MSALIIDGNATAEKIRVQLETEIVQLRERGCHPRLEVILVGDDPAAQSYVAMKQKDCERIGILGQTTRLGTETSEEELLALIDRFNHDASVHGILVQLPLPHQISEEKVIAAISPDKDVDGFHPVNVGRMVAGVDCFLPCTPAGIQALLVEYKIDPKGKHVVVVGRSTIVGKPFAIMMMQKKPWANATVTVCHTGSGDLKPYTQQADILVAAVGRPALISAEMIKPGAVVIDVGVNRIEDSSAKRGYRLVGDVDFAAVHKVASAITPVPGGVGPMTRAFLLKNTVKSAKKFLKLD
ncbi:bifunctional methylenetetrahydrofolate dehydrogenase/methenyltetrahydrofolate cyclohydrolase FolD [candidate division KSB1 bacterium]|nr:bifunctional methylenetetrahydrofolate dehydrogenase/methenyltetrahydrofolate cyclohydrolase FolD [candidate division KSB1 bacterium]RQW01415.1 MAG: bifunctional methylenetetrahydrofolate dehydrogenase/methenyltetrahydrofolate cyclohydrolase FolD [candidate division KSB1 bacterium]